MVRIESGNMIHVRESEKDKKEIARKNRQRKKRDRR